MSSNSEARKRREEQSSTTVSHLQGNADIEVTPTDSDSVVMDYLKSEAERLPGGTAAKVLAMTVPFDSKTHDFGSDAAPNRHDRTDAVTITISRKDAEAFVQDNRDPLLSDVLGFLIWAALREGEQ